MSALKTEVLELSARLQNSERERDQMQRKLADAMEEKERSHRRLEAVSSAHESRITEMHCVIVELSKKLKNHQENAIMEEHETEGSGESSCGHFFFGVVYNFSSFFLVSDLSFQEGSVYNSEMECTNQDLQSQTEPLDAKLIQPDRKTESPCSIPPATTTNTQLHVRFIKVRYDI